MIFATVGTQLPFNRLLGYLDDIADESGLHIIAQAGDTDRVFRNISISRSLSPSDFENNVACAELIVGHAGIGTILAAKRHRKSLVVVPRLSAFGEHRNDHQVATARQLNAVRGVYVADDRQSLSALIDRRSHLEPCSSGESPALGGLIACVRERLCSR